MSKREITIPESVKITDARGDLAGIDTPNGRVMLADPCECTEKKKGEAVQLGSGKPECETCKGKGLVPATYSFADYCEHLADDPKLQKSMAKQRAATALVDGPIDKKPGETFRLSDGSHRYIVEVLENPSEERMMIPVINRCAIRGGFPDAILNAKVVSDDN